MFPVFMFFILFLEVRMKFSCFEGYVNADVKLLRQYLKSLYS